jgi:hypothetical protein
MREIVEGRKIGYDMERDDKSGKMSACNLHQDKINDPNEWEIPRWRRLPLAKLKLSSSAVDKRSFNRGCRELIKLKEVWVSKQQREPL